MTSTASEQSLSEAEQALSSVPISQGERRGLRVLVVDDDPAAQTLCEIILKQPDDTRIVRCVSAGAEALRFLARETVDCVLLDYHLLDGKADSYIEQLTSLCPWTPIVMLLGEGDEKKAARAMRLGAADYLTKDRITAQALNRSMLNAITKWELSRSLLTERRDLLAANKELRKQRREIESFYHTVSHELKTPITAIREFNSLVSDGILGEVNEDQRDALDTSISCCDRLTRLVHDLFDAARIETGKLELHREEVDVQKLISREVRIMQSQACDRQISLVYAHDAALPLARVDSGRISQVLCNLISNAIKYTDYEGKVNVTATCDSNVIKVKVIDDGFGIASEHAEFIFDRLYQCDRYDEGDASSQNGMGIGLYLSHQIIQLHGGDISVVSKLGKGSTFTFTLPIAMAR